MKTWEMIKELTKNPKKKFIRRGDPLEISVDGLKYLRWKSGHDYINLDHEWEEVREPLSLTEFLQKVYEGYSGNFDFDYEKTIAYGRCSLGYMITDLQQDYSSDQVAEILLDGKFYIAD